MRHHETHRTSCTSPTLNHAQAGGAPSGGGQTPASDSRSDERVAVRRIAPSITTLSIVMRRRPITLHLTRAVKPRKITRDAFLIGLSGETKREKCVMYSAVFMKQGRLFKGKVECFIPLALMKETISSEMCRVSLSNKFFSVFLMTSLLFFLLQLDFGHPIQPNFSGGNAKLYTVSGHKNQVHHIGCV